MGASKAVRPLVFRVEASADVGLGHLMRCIAIAQAAEDHSIPSIFLLSEEGKMLARSRHDWTYQAISVPACQNQIEEGQWIRAKLVELGASAFIVDGYSFTSEMMAPARESGVCIVVLDDGYNRLTAFSDIIVNPASKELDGIYQQRQPNVCLCTGEQFRLLRREFQALSLPPFHTRHGIAVALGGSDPAGLTLPVLQLLQQSLPEVPVRVVTGAAYPHLPALRNFIEQSPLAIQHIHNCQNMADIWSHARLAISAAGGSQFELAVCQTPSLLLMVAENQRQATEHAQSQAWCKTFNCIEAFPEQRIAATARELFYCDEQLQTMSTKASIFSDSLGAERVLEAISRTV